MKKEIIIFKNKKPEKGEICSSLEHFCKEHCMPYRILNSSNDIKIKIDGELYQTELKEERSETPAYWMICCKMSGNSFS